MRRYIGGGTAVSRGRKVIGALLGSAAPAPLPITVTSGGVLTRTGSTVTWEPWTYAVAGLDTNTVTFVLDGADQAPGAITFPYTLAAGHTLAAKGNATKAGYMPASPNSNQVLNPAAIDIPAANLTVTEAPLDADTREPLVTVTQDPQAGFEYHVHRGYGANGITYLSRPAPDPLFVSAASAMVSAGAGVWTWQGGAAPLGVDVHGRVFEIETALGPSSARWCSQYETFRASNIPNAPTGVVISTGAGAGLIYVDVDEVGTVPVSDVARPITGMYATINGGVPFALTPSSGGVGRRIITALGTEPVSVQVHWQNVNGAGAATAAVSVTPGIATADIPTTNLSAVTYDGETFTFSAPVPVGFYEDGSPFILTDGGVTIIATGTPSVIVGTTIAHGAMANPYCGNNAPQGFDGLIATSTVGQLIPLAGNIDTTAAGAPYVVAPAAEVSVVKSKRLAGATANSWAKIEKYVPFTFLPASKRPKVGDFRPGMSTLDKTSHLNVNDVDLACCRNLDLTGLGYPTVATVLARWRATQPWYGIDGEKLRTMQVLTHVTPSNYTSDYAPPMIGDLVALINSNVTEAEKLQLAVVLATTSEDIAAQWYRGYLGKAGAGQHAFYSNVLATAAILYNSAYMLNVFYALQSNLDQVQWMEAADLGINTYWPTQNESGKFEFVAPIGAEELGKPAWVSGGYINLLQPANGSSLNRTYSDSGGAGRERTDSWAPILLFLANRSMPSGFDIVCGGAGTPQNNTFSPMSHRSAAPDRIDRDMTIYPLGDVGISTRARNFVAATRSLWPRPKKLFVPDTIYYSNFVAGANSVTWNYDALIAGNYFSSSPITAQHLYISQDNVQFMKVPSVAAIGSRALPGGIPHWCALSLQNAQGEGRRSYTFKHRTTEPANDRGYIVPTGTPTGAVVCIDPPQMMQREIPDHDNVPWYVPITGVLPAGTPIFVGSGIWDGALSGPVTTQLQVENVLNSNVWANEGAADVARYDPVIADGGKRFRVGATRNGVTAYSLPITLAVIPAIPAGAIIDTQFGPEFPLVYPAIWASMLANSVSGALNHRPHEKWRGANPVAPGGIILLKSAGTPRIVGEIPGLTIGQQYRLQAEVIVEGYAKLAGSTEWNGNGVFRLGSTSGGTQYYTGPINRNPAAGVQPLTVNLDVTFTATTTSVWLYNSIETSTGGSSGGHPALASLRLAPVA